MGDVKPFCVRNLHTDYRSRLEIEQLGDACLDRDIRTPEAERPGLSLSGLIDSPTKDRMLIFGRAELDFLAKMEIDEQKMRLEAVLNPEIPAIFVARGLTPPDMLLYVCRQRKIPVFVTPLSTMQLFSKLTILLSEEFSEQLSIHGTLVEAFGVGVLITGESAVGKSEAALGLIERGHRLISDDVVKVRKREGSYVEGSGPELTRHLLEIRGIGIINVAHLYGAVCVSERQRIDVVVKLETWDDKHFYDRVGLEEKRREYLGIKVPYHLVPVKPGRDVVLLIETIVLNHRLKRLGYNSAKEFNIKLLETIAKKHRRKQESAS